MIYRIFIFIAILSACQRKTVPEPGIAVNVEIDTSVVLIPDNEIPENPLKDVHHLLEIGL